MLSLWYPTLLGYIVWVHIQDLNLLFHYISSVGLRSNDSGGHFNTQNFLCYMNQSATVLSYWKRLPNDRYTIVINWGTRSVTILGSLQHLNLLLVPKVPMHDKKILLMPLHHHDQKFEPLIQGRTNLYFHILSQILKLTTVYCNRNWNSSDQANFFPNFFSFFLSLENCNISFLFLTNRRATQFNILLL